jgi:hypothetical protein
MELFQSSLLVYWEFEPEMGEEEVKPGEDDAEAHPKVPKERKIKDEPDVPEDSARPGEKIMRKKKAPPKKVFQQTTAQYR